MIHRYLLIALVILSLCSSQGLMGQESSVLRVGFAKIDVTPQMPTPMAGYYHARLSTQTHDALWCRTTLLDDGKTRLAIVSLDLITTTRWLVTESRSLIESQLKIPAQNVLISASHSHTGPVISDPNSTRYQQIVEANPSAEAYMLGLPAKICACVEAAVANLSEASVGTTIAREEKLAFNRRFFMKDGSVGWNPGKRNPNIVREAGPTDDTLPIVCFYDKAKQVRGMLLNYSIHLDTVGGTEWSADMPFTLIQSLEKVFGANCHIQYSTGCCGDINHLDVRSELPQKGHGEAARIGTRLAAAALRSLNDFRPIVGSGLHATSQSVKLGTAKHPKARVQWAEDIATKSRQAKQPDFRDMVEAYRILDIEARDEAPYEVEVQVLSLGKDIAWVSMPGEIFVQLGIAIKDASPFSTTSIHELANGSIGYIPTRQAYAQGNYEVISARCAEGSGEQIVENAVSQLREHYHVQISQPTR